MFFELRTHVTCGQHAELEIKSIYVCTCLGFCLFFKISLFIYNILPVSKVFFFLYLILEAP